MWKNEQKSFFSKLLTKKVEIPTFLSHIKCKKNILDVLKSLVTSPGPENSILNDFFMKKVKKF